MTDSYWLLIEGRWRVERRIAGDVRLMFEADRPGSWTGGIPVIDKIAPPRAIILEASRLLRAPSAVIDDLAGVNTGVAKRLLAAVNWGSGHIGDLIPDRSQA